MSLNGRIFAGALGGIALGLAISHWGATSAVGQTVLYGCDLASGVFIALLKMILIPLVFTSIAVGVARLSEHAQIHRVWLTTLAFFFATTLVAIVLGIGAMHLFNPAGGLELALFAESMRDFTATSMDLPDFFRHFLVRMFSNPIEAMAGGNILAVVVFALFMGIALVSARGKYPTLQIFLEECFALMMQLVNAVMQVAPIGILALLARLVAVQDAGLFLTLGKFMGVVIGITLFHGLVVLPLLVYGLTGITPLHFARRARYVWLTAFATSSSTATLPLTLKCLEEDLQVPRDVANFVAPVGAQMNMDGTALYEAAAALFVASLAGLELSLGQQLVVCLTAMVAAIGAPGIPSAGMVTMVMVLQSVGLPAEAVAILLPIDRLLDAFRTAVNVTGDMSASLVVARFAGPPGTDSR